MYPTINIIEDYKEALRIYGFNTSKCEAKYTRGNEVEIIVFFFFFNICGWVRLNLLKRYIYRNTSIGISATYKRIWY